jgi:hypothetical protein
MVSSWLAASTRATIRMGHLQTLLDKLVLWGSP